VRLAALIHEAEVKDYIRPDLVMDRLDTTNYESHKNRNPPAVEGTCVWVLSHTAFKNWFDSTDSSLLWISADPGCGKSVLASFLVDHFVRSQDVNVCYFFFKSDSLDQSSAINGIRAILHQLYKQQAELMATSLNHLQNNNIQNLGELWKALVVSTMHKDARKTVCILDGVDECEAQSRKSLLRVISDFFITQTTQDLDVDTKDSRRHLETSEACPSLKFIITSRPENQIKAFFGQQPLQRQRQHQHMKATGNRKQYAAIRLRGEDEPDAISNDVAIVVRSRIADMIYSGLPAQLLEAVEAELIIHADRTFLWVSLVLSLLEEKVEEGASKRELDEILRTRDIYDVYGKLLASRSESSRARKLLNIVLAATGPLTLEEVSVALSVTPDREFSKSQAPLRPGKATFDDVEYEMVFPFENHLKVLCGHFLRIIRNRLYLVHETAREYLLALANSEPTAVYRPLPFSSSGKVIPSDMPSSAALFPMENREIRFQHSFSLTEAHALLLDLCAGYLYCLAKRCKSAPDLGNPSAMTQPFLGYAARCWTIHFRKVAFGLRRHDLQYYQNLCHPSFPGFDPWIRAFWYPRAPNHPQADTPQDVLDYYVDYFELDVTAGKAIEDGLSGNRLITEDSETPSVGQEYWEDYWEERQGGGRLKQLRQEYANSLCSPESRSNPASLSRHFFPEKVDATGFVSLDFPGSPGRQLHASRRKTDFKRKQEDQARYNEDSVFLLSSSPQ
jgi:protein SERAC1